MCVCVHVWVPWWWYRDRRAHVLVPKGPGPAPPPPTHTRKHTSPCARIGAVGAHEATSTQGWPRREAGTPSRFPFPCLILSNLLTVPLHLRFLLATTIPPR